MERFELSAPLLTSARLPGLLDDAAEPGVPTS